MSYYNSLHSFSDEIFLRVLGSKVDFDILDNEIGKKNSASSGNRTRAARVAGEHSTTEPTMLTCRNVRKIRLSTLHNRLSTLVWIVFVFLKYTRDLFETCSFNRYVWKVSRLRLLSKHFPVVDLQEKLWETMHFHWRFLTVCVALISSREKKVLTRLSWGKGNDLFWIWEGRIWLDTDHGSEQIFELWHVRG